MIAYPASLVAVGGARTGIAPVNLLDIEDVNGNLYHWADRPIQAPLIFSVVTVDGRCVPWRTTATQNTAYNVAGNDSSGLDPVSLAVIPGTQIRATYVGGLASISNPIGTTYGAGQGNGYGSWDAAGQVGQSGNGSGLAGYYVTAPINDQSLIGAWADDTGQLVQAPFGIGNDSGVLTVPSGATQLLMGMNDGTDWSDNSGAWTIQVQGAGVATYKPWLLSVPEFSFHRSLQTNVGSFILQNLSGDTLARDFEKIMRRSALEGSMFIWRLWQPDAQAAWLEVHGTVTVDAIGVDTVTLKGTQLLNPSQEDTPLEIYSETCQLQWGGRRCGSTQADECSYSYQTCQVIERPMIVMNDYEKNYGETLANIAEQVVNRARKI